MKVNRNNYEIWMIDYFDGKLNAIEREILFAFLDLNPDLKEEFDLFDANPIEAEQLPFSDKPLLKKQEIEQINEISESNYEEYFIAYYENDLSDKQKNDVKEFCARNPQLKMEFQIHQKLYIKADNSLIFEDKSSLKRKRRLAVYWWSGTAAAVIILLLGWLGFLNENVKETPVYSRESVVTNRMQPASADMVTLNEINIIFTKSEMRPRIISFPESRNTQREHLYAFTLESQSIDLDLVDNGDVYIIESYLSADYITSLAITDANPVRQKKKGLLGRIIKNLSKKASNRFPDENLAEKNTKDPTFVRLLDQSITVFNTITGSDTELAKSYDNNGNLTQYHVDGGNLSWSKNYSQEHPSE